MHEGKTIKNYSYLKIIARPWLFFLLLFVLIFISAGRLNYRQGWLFAAIITASLVIISFLFTGKKDILLERIHPGPGTKWWDKIFFAFYIPVSLSVFIVSALDAGRLHWTAPIPPLVYIIALPVFILSYSTIIWAMWTNKFFSSTVRIQTDRGHQVIKDGPYRFVRHPGYLAAIFWFISVSLTLGSLYGLIPVSFIVVLLIIRTYLEDITLQKELPGYCDYAKNVPSRLIPHIW